MDVKITKKMLNDYRKTKREIPLLEAELLEMQQGDAGLGNSTIFDYRTGFPRPQSVVGFDWELYQRRKNVLAKKRAEVKAVDEWVNGIEDTWTRFVFRAFYIDGQGWNTIAQRLGYTNNPDYPRLYIRDKYLKDKQVK